MRAPLILLACLLVLTGGVQARLGETLEQCSERYGPLIERRQAQFPQSDPEVAVFSKSAVTIFVEFKGGKAWHITFRKLSFTGAEIDTLIKSDSGDADWSPPLTAANRTFRESEDHTRLSVVMESRLASGSTVEVMTNEYIDQLRANYLERARKPGAVEEMKRKVNPLPGF